MKVTHYVDVWEVATPDELERVLTKGRKSAVNAFWLSHGDDIYPVLGLLLKGNLAWLNYLPEDKDAGFVSLGEVPEIDPLENTLFSQSPNRADDLSISDQQVIPLAEAI